MCFGFGMNGFSCQIRVAGGVLEAVQTSPQSCMAISPSEYECNNLLSAARKKSSTSNNRKRDQHLMRCQYLFASQVNVSGGHREYLWQLRDRGWLCWASVAC